MNERNIPPCGRLIEYREPHSPFQKLIDARREQFGLSGRDLAERIGVSQSTVWIWLHNLNGYPHPKSFKPGHVSRICEVLKIPEAKLKSALDASRHLFTPRKPPVPHEAFDSLGNFIHIIENDTRSRMSKDYVLNLAKNLHRGAKVTLLVLAAVVSVSIARADDLVTLAGKRYENVRVTEITPTTIAFMHATGAARLPFTDFGTEVHRKYGYDEAKAKAWLAEQAGRAAEITKGHQVQRDNEGKQGAEIRRRVDAIAHYLDDGGHVAIDPHSGLLYDPEVETPRRAEAWKWIQRYGTPHQSPIAR
jgi:transcriptional regulator with XRE-family HTH domain